MKRIHGFFIAIIFSSLLQAQPTLSLRTVITGLSQPMQLVDAGDSSGRVFIPQKGGSIRVYDRDFQLKRTFLTVTGIPTGGEQGLLSMVFHPNFRNNGFFFIFYTNGNSDLEISRYKVSAVNPDSADVASRVVVITIPHPTNTNHNGGELHFGPDGYLYLTTGDGGGGGDPANNAQNTSNLLGKLIRIDVSTGDTPPFYQIPSGNPFGNPVYAYGLRNPYRWEFDRQTGDVWIGDVGQGGFEEVNFRPADSVAGTNFGWRCYEGFNTYNSTGCGPASSYTKPVLVYPTPPRASVTGGTVYRGGFWGDLQGWYLASDFYTGRWYKMKYNTGTQLFDTSTQVISPTGIVDYGEDQEGEMFATCLNNGTVYRITTNGPADYLFTGNGNWNRPSNWKGRVMPPSTLPAGSRIIIRPEQGGECILNVQQTIPSGAELIVENDKQLRINGNLTVQ